MNERIQARLVELKQKREEIIGALNQINGAIAILEELLKPEEPSQQ